VEDKVKKIVFFSILAIGLASGLFAQEIQRLTFTDMRSDGTIIGTVTVNAIFLTWKQHNISLENGMQITYGREYIKGEWTPWELMQREPAYVLTLRQIYDGLLRQYNITPRASVRLYFQGIQFIRIMTIPSGRSSPMWWSDDGRSFNIMFETWAIIP
jgi:hypothetical protein